MEDNNLTTLLGASVLFCIVDGLGDSIHNLVGPQSVFGHPFAFLFTWLPFYVAKFGVMLMIGSSFLNLFFGRHIRMIIAAAQARQRASMKGNITKNTSPTKNTNITKDATTKLRKKPKAHGTYRATDNWKVLKELEKAAKVYWRAKDQLPPRTVKIDINLEKDLAYALNVRVGPQILFLRGTRILHREQQIRTADELVEMIAYFYYKARKPSWMTAATK